MSRALRVDRPARAPLGLRDVAVRPVGLDGLFLLALLVCTWEKLSWNVLGRLALTDLVEAAFVVGLLDARLVRRDRRVAPTAVVVACFGLAFLAVYLGGFGNLETDDAVGQWTKGLAKWVIHFSFLAAAAAHLVRRGAPLLRAGLVAFVAGVVVNSLYAVLLLAAQVGGGVNLDRVLLSHVFTGAATSGVNLYGRVAGVTSQGVETSTTVYRATGLVDDPNHLGVMLTVPIVVLLALALGLRGRDAVRARIGLGALAAFLLLVLLLTQSRSGVLGLAVGLAVLAVPFGRQLASRAVLLPGAALALLAGAVALQRRSYVQQVIESRLQTGGGGNNTHLAVYELIPQVIDSRPLLGVGLNNFSVLYEFETGRTNFGPHSYYVSVLTETGLVGAAVALAFVLWVLDRTVALARVGAEAAADPSDSGAPHALGWGLTAAVAATLAGNVFYLTMTFPYWYLFVALAVSAAPTLAPAARARARARLGPAAAGAD